MVSAAPIFECKTEITNISPLRSTSAFNPCDKVFAFSGLGNPDAFVSQLKANKIEIVSSKNFPDHHKYSQVDVEIIGVEARHARANALITTAKDAVKLVELKFEMPVFVAEIEVVIDVARSFEDLL